MSPIGLKCECSDGNAEVMFICDFKVCGYSGESGAAQRPDSGLSQVTKCCSLSSHGQASVSISAAEECRRGHSPVIGDQGFWCQRQEGQAGEHVISSREPKLKTPG